MARVPFQYTLKWAFIKRSRFKFSLGNLAHQEVAPKSYTVIQYLLPAYLSDKEAFVLVPWKRRNTFAK